MIKYIEHRHSANLNANCYAEMAVQLSFPPCSCLLFACLVLSEIFTKFLAEEPNSAAGGALYLSKVLEIDETSDNLNHFDQSISY